MKTHRHERSSWLICLGLIEWCYVCGAWRHLMITPKGLAIRKEKKYKGWRKPSGDPKINPYKSSPTVVEEK